MSDVTRILSAIEQGDQLAAEQLLPLVYEELRKLAAQKMVQEAPGQTLQATALVHEAYLRLVGGDSRQHWNGRAHFFGAAAEAMRRILIEAARRKGRLKREGRLSRRDLDGANATADELNFDVLDVDEALIEFSRQHPEKAELVKLRYFAGMSLDESAGILGISPATADRQWKYARAWLARALRETPPTAPS
jgi:RNA polymerase sigma factor (TIGR02999 family)